MGEKRIARVDEIDSTTVCLTTDEGTQEFHIPIRTFYVDALSLDLIHGMSDGNGEYADQPKPNRRITGVAKMQDPSISVIGDCDTRSKTLELSIYPTTESEHKTAIEREAARNAREDNKDGDWWKSIRYADAILCFQAADWEIPFKDHWWIQLSIPETVFDCLWAEVKAQAISTFCVGISFRDLYCDDNHSPPSLPVNWYLRPCIRDGDTRRPELAKGMICSLSYQAGSTHLAAEVAKALEDAETVDDPLISERGDAVRRHTEILQALALMSQSIQQLGVQTRNAAWVIAVAVLLSAIFH